jgi:ATP-dependent helicase STH1/SNF2
MIFSWFNTPFAATGEKIEVNEEEQLLIIKRLHKVLRPFLLRRLKKEVEKDLPDKTERILKTPLSAIQQKLYSQVLQSGAMMIRPDESGKRSTKSINNTIMQLRKICNHPYVFSEVEDVLNPNSVTDMNIFRTSGKFELLDRILPKFKATGHRVLYSY